MGRFVSWWRNGEYSCIGHCFDIGNTTREALQRYLETGRAFAGSSDDRSAGNGSLMRLAPVALYGIHDPVLASSLARQQSRTTHAAPQAIDACDLFVGLLRTAILTGDRSLAFRSVEWSGHPSLSEIAKALYRRRQRSRIKSSGYVVATLEAALWATESTSSFEEALVLAVNLGDDADTVGAVTGQIAGALYGAEAIPRRWLQSLSWRQRIDALARWLVEAAPKNRPILPESN